MSLPRSLSRWSWLLLCAAALLATACGDDEKPAPKAAPATPPAAPDPGPPPAPDPGPPPAPDPGTPDPGQAAQTTPVMVVAIPEAEVFRDGSSLGPTPYAMLLTADQGDIKLELRATDHHPKEVVVNAQSPERIEIHLESTKPPEVTKGKKKKRKGKRSNRRLRGGHSDGPVIADPVRLRKAVMDVFRRRKSAISSCYQRALQRNPGASGKLFMRFTVERDGFAYDLGVQKNETGDELLPRCIFPKVRQWHFPRPKREAVTFVYPLVLKKGDQAGGG